MAKAYGNVVLLLAMGMHLDDMMMKSDMLKLFCCVIPTVSRRNVEEKKVRKVCIYTCGSWEALDRRMGVLGPKASEGEGGEEGGTR